MPWSGSGSFSRTDGTRTGAETWTEADAASVGILSADHDTHDQDLADGIENCLTIDGQNSPTANINWGGFTITNLGGLDLNGTEMILDADADTSVTADTDDQIDFKLSGSDRFQMLLTGGIGEFRLSSSDAGATAGPFIVFDRASVSPVASDLLGQMTFRGKDDGGNSVDYAAIRGQIADPVDGSEDGRIAFEVISAGAAKTIMQLGSGPSLTLRADDAGASVNPLLILHRQSASPASSDDLSALRFDGQDDGGTQTTYAQIHGVIADATDTSEDGELVLSVATAGALTEVARAEAGAFLVGKANSNLATAGVELLSATVPGRIRSTVDGAICIEANRLTSDGAVIAIIQDGTTEGTISVSGTTVAYNAFTGSHWSQWATGAEPPADPPEGTLLSATDEPWERQLAVNSRGNKRRHKRGPLGEGEQLVDAPKPQLVKCAITSQRADPAVYGTFGGHTEDGDVLVYGLGTVVVRVVGPISRGDLIQASATPGVAERQPQPVMGPHTVGKVMSGDNRTDERLRPAVLYCG